MPRHSAPALLEDFAEEGHAGEDAGGFSPEDGRAGDVAYYEAADVEGGRVFG